MEILLPILIFMCFGALISVGWYLLPYIILIWLVLFIIKSIQQLIHRKKVKDQYQEYFTEAKMRQPEVQKRNPLADSIDVDFVEHEADDIDDASGYIE
jgi:uncharacterized membrane protein YhiD involved in acid resistance